VRSPRGPGAGRAPGRGPSRVPAGTVAVGLLLTLLVRAGAPASARSAPLSDAPRSPVAPIGNAEAPPPAHTGGFGEPTCHACHGEYALDLEGGSLAVEGLGEGWTPGEAHVLTVILSSSEMAKAGFELALRGEDGRQAGRLRALDARAAVTEQDGVQYAHHTAPGSMASDARVASWTVEWTAPRTGGVVRLHAAANSANGDDSPFGDLVYTVTADVGRRPSR
jgi:hypothetical protein